MVNKREVITRLKYLEAFKNTIDTGSISKAAELMQMQQSSVSYLIGKLEENAGTQLFIRANGRVSPTSRALDLYKEVDLLLNQIMHIEAQFNRPHFPYGSRLKLGCPHGYTDTLMPAFLRQLHQRDPLIRFQIETLSFDNTLEGLEQGKLDIGFTALQHEGSGHYAIPLATTHHVCILSKADPLAQKEVVSLSDFHGRTLVTQNRRSPLLKRYKDLFQSMNVHCTEQVVSAGTNLIAEMLDIYGALGRGNSCFAEAFCKAHPHLCFRPIAELDDIRTLKLLLANWVKGTDLEHNLHQAMLETIRPFAGPWVEIIEPDEGQPQDS
ncbi:MAG: LysR family transcriptional regulator [Cohaesibacter sp.]|nr:LysR family transcriptional regulator [Cohaesibacter sp.]